jgi:hypothetical protein
MYLPEPSTKGMIESIRNYVEIMLSDTEDRMHEGLRMLLASLAGEGGYASLIYRRAQRKMQSRIAAAMQAARDAGDLQGRELGEKNLAMFQEHLGTMLNMVRALPNHAQLYDEDNDRLIRDAVWFCCRGIGLTHEAILRIYGD